LALRGAGASAGAGSACSFDAQCLRAQARAARGDQTFRLTPSEAKLACIIARGAPPDIAARELKISRETARNQLKAVFAKTDTHRQSELVALLLQVE
jgi:DNA-binding CsgD family transcriptional regulator